LIICSNGNSFWQSVVNPAKDRNTRGGLARAVGRSVGLGCFVSFPSENTWLRNTCPFWEGSLTQDETVGVGNIAIASFGQGTSLVDMEYDRETVDS
jgi:hypothetical protein